MRKKIRKDSPSEIRKNVNHTFYLKNKNHSLLIISLNLHLSNLKIENVVLLFLFRMNDQIRLKKHQNMTKNYDKF